jgi:hypothetical protein
MSLIGLIEHQEELLTAITAPLNYCSLCALRISCKALFAAVSNAHQWQHMHRMQSNLQQINSIQRAILMDYCYDTLITIIHNNKNITCYAILASNPELEIYGGKFNYEYDITDVIEYYPLGSLLISGLRDSTTAPKWLLKCINKIRCGNEYLTEILNIRP